MTSDQSPAAGRPLSRRHLLWGGAAAGVGAAGAIAIDLGSSAGQVPLAESPGGSTGTLIAGADTFPFYGQHQSGVETEPQAHATFVALDLHDDVDASALQRLMRVLTADAAKLTQGKAALADTEAELAVVPARLTITFGFGPGLVARVGESATPTWLRPLPAFGIDRLDDRWNGGDLLLQIGADDALTVAHATRMLLKDSRSFATPRWRQTGFRRAVSSEAPGTTMRNLFGQVDGTANPAPGSPDFANVVWNSTTNPAWLAGGTSLVLRRIAMNLDTWDKLDRSGRELAVGRRLSNGAPLTGENEKDAVDFDATTVVGLPVIPAISHIRRARTDVDAQRIFRRGFNYDGDPTETSVSDSGLLFASFQADVDAQFVPIQSRLAEVDLLNQWTTPIGSAVFAIPPGCSEGGYIGDTLF